MAALTRRSKELTDRNRDKRFVEAVLTRTYQTFVAIVGLAVAISANASTPISGAITQSTEWTASGSPYVLSGSVTVSNGAQLLIDAGVRVQMGAGAGLEVVAGALSAQGTSANPIIITSTATTPARGDWGTLTFDSGTIGSSTALTYVTVQYGHGIMVQGASPTFHNVSINHHIGAAMSIDLQSSPAGDHLSASDNDLNGILVPAGEMGADVTWGLTGIPYVVQQGAVTVGKRVFGLSPSRLTLVQGATATFELDVPDPAPVGGLSVDTLSTDTSVATVPSSVAVASGAQTANISVTGVAIGSSTITASHASYGSTTAVVDVIAPSSMTLSPQAGSVDIGYSTSMTVTLSSVAPAGGIVVSLVSSAPAVITVPSQIVVPSGQKTVSFPAQSTGVGNATITATTQSFGGAAASIAVHALSLTLPPSIVVPPSGTTSVTLRLSEAAPPGGLTVALSTGNTALATVPATISIAAGSLVAPFTLTGLTQGTTTLTATASGYATATSTITVNAISILFSPSAGALYIPAGRNQTLQVQLSKAAPSGGVSISLAMTDGTRASVWPTTINVPGGQTAATQSITVYGIVASENTYTTLTAQAPGLTDGSERVWVEGPGVVSLYDNYADDNDNSIVGKGLAYNNEVYVELDTTDGYTWSTPTALTVTLTNSDPTKLTSPASVTIPAGSNHAYFNISGIDFTEVGNPVLLSASTPDMAASSQLSVSVVVPLLQLSNLDGTRNALNGSRDDFYLSWLVGGYRTQVASAAQNVLLSIVADNPAGMVPGFHDAVTGGNPISQVNIASGAIQSGTVFVDSPTSIGTYQVQATLPGVGSWTSPVQTASNPALQFFDTPSLTAPISSSIVGKGLSLPYLTIGLIGSNGQPLTSSTPIAVSLTSSDSSKVTIPASVTIPAGQSFVYCPITAVDLTTSAVTVNAVAAGFPGSSQLTVNVVTPTLQFFALDGSRATFSSPDIFSIGWTVPGSTSIQGPIADQTFTLSIVAANPPGIVTGFNTGLSGGATVTIPARQSQSGQVAVNQPTSNGTYQVQATLPGVGAWTSDVQSVGVPVLTYIGGVTGPLNIGQGLQAEVDLAYIVGGFYGTPSAPITVNLASSDPANVTVPSSVTIPAACCGQAFARIYISGANLTTTPATISASVAGYASPPPVTVNVVTPTLQFSNLDGGRTLVSDRDNFYVSWVVPGGPGGQLASASQIFSLSIANASPAGIVPGFHDNSAQFYSNPITQVTIPAGRSVSSTVYVDQPLAIGSYVVQADLPGVGNWTSALQTVVVPSLYFGTGSNTNFEVVGKGLSSSDTGLRVGTSGFLATPMTVNLACVDPTVCSVPSTVTLPAGSQPNIAFAVQGLNAGTTQVTAAAPGFLPPNLLNISVVTPTIQLENVPSILASGTSANLAVYVNVQGAFELAPFSTDTTIALTSSNPAVASIPASVTIPAGQPTSGVIVLTGISPGTTTITASGTNLLPVTTLPITVQ